MRSGIVTSLFVLLGMVVIGLAGALVRNTEDRAAKRQRAVERLGGRVETADPNRIDPALDGQLIRLEGFATAEGLLEDPIFGVRSSGLLLSRSVEMWQWLERDSEVGVVYEQGWSDTLVDSDRFVVPEAHRNPDVPRLPPKVFTNTVHVGEFVVPDNLVRAIQQREPVPVSAAGSLPESVPESLQPAEARDGVIYVAQNPEAPQVGDLRISFEIVRPMEVRLLGVQQGNTLTHFGQPKKPRFLVLKLENQPLFPFLDGITPAQIWVYRGVALVGLVLGIALLRRGLPPVHRPRMGVAWLLASSIACAVAASVWFEYSQSRAWVLGTVAGLTCMLGLRSIRR